jgi:hypothetical protein
MMMTSLSVSASVVVRAIAVVPAVLLILFVGPLLILGLACGSDRRRYVVEVSQQAMVVIGMLMHGHPATLPGGGIPGD